MNDREEFLAGVAFIVSMIIWIWAMPWAIYYLMD